ncbi:MAG: DUF1641 domain-containing protein [Bacteroidales bacterium]|nr:DUF1641 domain-containing protein [Bacteroidales bacterium]
MMEVNNIQTQIDVLNQKMDLILESVNQQRLRTESVTDLMADLSIVGKDMYDSTVEELENQKVEIDIDELKILGVKLLKNIGNISTVVNLFESMNDLAKDASPIINEMIIDFTKKLHEIEKKGYFEFFTEIGKVVDNIITHFSKDDVHQLAENIVTILETVKSMTQPEMLESVNNALKVYNSIQTKNVPEYSIWRLMRELGNPEMKKSIGFMVTFLKNLSTIE